MRRRNRCLRTNGLALGHIARLLADRFAATEAARRFGVPAAPGQHAREHPGQDLVHMVSVRFTSRAPVQILMPTCKATTPALKL